MKAKEMERETEKINEQNKTKKVYIIYSKTFLNGSLTTWSNHVWNQSSFRRIVFLIPKYKRNFGTRLIA